MVLFKSLFENINVVVPYQKIFFWIAAPVADANARCGYIFHQW